MKYHVLTLFPDMIDTVARTSILGRALKCGAIGLDLINIRDFSTKNSMRVDGYPYGGGAGMVMEAEPVFQAVSLAKKRAPEGTRVIYLTPAAPVLTQTKAEELAKEEELILLCGHYEGIDERVLEEVVTDNISIGDYVLTGGELGACVLMDAVSRFIPGVLHNDESSQVESIQDNLLEYPQYTRPEVWHGKAVPELLLTGDHAKIEAWRHEQSVKRTKERRPDLFAKSYRVKVVQFGTEQNAHFAEELAGQISNYAEVLDYNRRKLQKQKLRFGSKDLVVIVTDTPEALSPVLDKMTADGARAIIVGIGETSEE
ncbi:MAG: tRNA (guanosine(37)-N1)-methyltransferase TrmD [Lentisphaeria bacterium]|nr:tRNA (guanosine(37)-N1)-methyltransferase TrmD [Lentisphaeria bacterium]